jgi:hypothetical protein
MPRRQKERNIGPGIVQLAKHQVMDAAARAGITTQAHIYRELRIDPETWRRRFEGQGWPWESVIALCSVIECTGGSAMSEYKTEYQGSWIGVDFDGTLATYDGWKGPAVLGEPILEMVGRVSIWLSNGEDVRIMTARVSPVCPPGKGHYPGIARIAIQEWCIKHIGCELPITHEKDYLMRELWDDRAIQVQAGTGIPVEQALERELAQTREALKDACSDLGCYGCPIVTRCDEVSDLICSELPDSYLQRAKERINKRVQNPEKGQSHENVDIDRT